jgi:hypothetical protein
VNVIQSQVKKSRFLHWPLWYGGFM